jgi:hypothetical protein
MIGRFAHDLGGSESVNRVVLTTHPSLPVFPRQRTSSEAVGMSQRCQERKSLGVCMKLQEPLFSSI